MTVEPQHYTVLYAEPLLDDLDAIFRAELPDGFRLQIVETRGRDELLRRAREADFIVVATARVDEELLSMAPRLRLVQHAGVGYDNVDLAACRRAGVPLALMPLNVETGVAEHAILLMLAVYKQLPRMDRAVRAGGWPNWSLRASCFELGARRSGWSASGGSAERSRGVRGRSTPRSSTTT